MPSRSKKAIPVAVPVTRRRRSPLTEVWGFLIWLVGIIVSLAIGFAMASGPLTQAIPFLPAIIHQLVGWIVIVLVLLGVLLKIVDKFSG